MKLFLTLCLLTTPLFAEEAEDLISLTGNRSYRIRSQAESDLYQLLLSDHATLTPITRSLSAFDHECTPGLLRDTPSLSLEAYTRLKRIERRYFYGLFGDYYANTPHHVNSIARPLLGVVRQGYTVHFSLPEGTIWDLPVSEYEGHLTPSHFFDLAVLQLNEDFGIYCDPTNTIRELPCRYAIHLWLDHHFRAGRNPSDLTRILKSLQEIE